MRKFVHLHVHTEFSLLDGAAKIKTLNKKCREMNMPAVAITDHGNMYGICDMYDTFTERKLPSDKRSDVPLKGIVGCEFYITKDHKVKTGGMKSSYHLVLLAKDFKGYKNLLKLNSIAYTEGFYYKPRIDWALLEKYKEGLICMSACLAGYMPQLLLKGDVEGAKEHAKYLQGLFGEDFYIELQDHGIQEQKETNPILYQIANELGIKVVATNDVHYINQEDAEMQDVLICVQTGKTIDDPNRMKFSSDEFYLKSGDEMAELFDWCPEAIDNTLEVADKCNVDLLFKQPLLPPYHPDDGSTPEQYLRKLTFAGLKKRYGEVTESIKERAEYELNIITTMGFCEYFLIVWDFINYALMHDIPVGAGRGSGVGSIVAYAVEITNVDPLKYNLLFERFLNPERVSNPDFDIDFCYEGRSQVIDYVNKKYGADKVTQIITFGTMAAKAAIKDVARVYKMPYSEVDKVTKLMPVIKANIANCLGLNPKKAKEKIPEIVEIYENNESMRQVLDMAMKLEGMPRNTSMHAAGVVICRDVVSDHVPLARNGEDITTQYNKDQIEDIGLLKMDFLGLRTLTDVKYAKLYVKETTGDEIDFKKLGYADPEVYNLIGSGLTDAVFQLESPGMKVFMKQLKPQKFEDIVAGISLYRPGPMDSIPQFIKGKTNPDEVTYDHELLKPILDVTYGCVVYQEQVMQIVRSLAGYTFGRADILRRAMSKKKQSVMVEEKQIFIHGCEAKDGNPAVDGAIKRGVPEEVASKIYDGIYSFASYAFNKSHAAAYSVLSYETAFLKRYYPIQFLTAVINNRIHSPNDVSKYILHAKDSGYEIYQPDINLSKVKFSCDTKSIRFGLMAIKNVGEAAVEKIIKEREENGNFKNLYDFILRVDGSILNKRMIENMIQAGAFDCFGETRTTHMASYEEILNTVSIDKKMKDSGQLSLFEMDGIEDEKEYELRQAPEYSVKEKLAREKEVIGIYVTGHPLEEYSAYFKNMPFNTQKIAEIQDTEDKSWVKEYDGKPITICGMLIEATRRVDKNGREMALCKIEDLYGSVEIIFFSRAYGLYKNLLIQDTIVSIKGKISTRRDTISIMGDSVSLWNTSTENKAKQENKLINKQKNTIKPNNEQVLYVKLNDYSNKIDMDKEYNELIKILSTYKGNVKAYVQIGKKLYDTNTKVSVINALKYELYSLLGARNVKFKL